jgi:acid stress-induced BolA-like protein IbaG/YrbA
MDLVSAACFSGLSPERQRQQIYLALYNWASDDSLIDPSCFPALPYEVQDAALLAALRIQSGNADSVCFGGLTQAQRQQQIYAELYTVAGDGDLIDPGCFLSLSPTHQSQALYAAYYSIAGDGGLTDPACFYGLSPWQQIQSLFSVLNAISGGGDGGDLFFQPSDSLMWQPGDEPIFS